MARRGKTNLEEPRLVRPMGGLDLGSSSAVPFHGAATPNSITEIERGDGHQQSPMQISAPIAL
jgi:hypothetical protein